MRQNVVNFDVSASIRRIQFA